MTKTQTPNRQRQVYNDIFGPLEGERMIDKASSGLLLSLNMERTFKNYYWSLYCAEVSGRAADEQRVDCGFADHPILRGQDGAYYVHVFFWTRTMAPYHGKRIDPTTRLNLGAQPNMEPPNRDCLRWHYKQCVQARLRGYAYGMAIDLRGGAVPPPPGAPPSRPD
jgi:hypothetical protein